MLGYRARKKKVTFIKAQFQTKSNVKSQLNPLHIIKINLILDLRTDKKDAATMFHTALHAHTDIPGDLVATKSCAVSQQTNIRMSETHQLHRHIWNTNTITAAKYGNKEI
jgi:hypothetical protein